MKSKVTLLLILTVSLLLQDFAEAWSLRRAFRRLKKGVKKLGNNVKKAVKKVGSKVGKVLKKIGSKAGKLLCKSVCGKFCPKIGPVIGATHPIAKGAVIVGCHFGCSKLCKRSVNHGYFGNRNFTLVPLPTDFNHYDLDGDKYITIDEFSRAEMLPRDEVANAFRFSDFDGDGKLDQDEFITAPFIFSEQIASEINELTDHEEWVVEPEHNATLSDILGQQQTVDASPSVPVENSKVGKSRPSIDNKPQMKEYDVNVVPLDDEIGQQVKWYSQNKYDRDGYLVNEVYPILDSMRKKDEQTAVAA